MRICLVYPQGMDLPDYFDGIITSKVGKGQTLPPLGILYIISNSKYYNNMDFIDNRIAGYSEDELYQRLLDYDIIGFGGTIFDIQGVRNLSIRLMAESKRTIYGGPNTINANLYEGQFSLIFKGEADLEFDSAIESDKTYYVAKRIKYLSDLHWPAREMIHLNHYMRSERALKGYEPTDVVVSSRGCPFLCSHCSSKDIWDRKYTGRDIDEVVKEISYLEKFYGTKSIYFREDNFTVYKKRLKEMSKKMTLPWMCESRVDGIDEERLKMMVDGGCKAIWFGIESTDELSLSLIDKGITLEQIYKALNLCKKYGIYTMGSFMFGFPHDTWRSIIKNFRGANKLGLNHVSYNRIFSFPVSRLHDQIIREGLDYYTFENITLPRTKFLSADNLNRLYKVANLYYSLKRKYLER